MTNNNVFELLYFEFVFKVFKSIFGPKWLDKMEGLVTVRFPSHREKTLMNLQG